MYKITFNLTAPVCMIDRPIFDGILIYCYMKEKFGNMYVDLRGKIDKDHFPDLPVRYHADGFPLSSIMFFDRSIESTGSWKKRWDNKNDDLSDFGKNIRKIKTSGGAFKSYDMPMALHDINQCWFYFESDDIERVQYLILTQLAGIGKKTSQGFGFYSEFRIDDAEIDMDFDIDVMRPRKLDLPSTKKLIEYRLTAAMQQKKPCGFQNQYCSWRPAYWDADNYNWCIVP